MTKSVWVPAACKCHPIWFGTLWPAVKQGYDCSQTTFVTWGQPGVTACFWYLMVMPSLSRKSRRFICKGQATISSMLLLLDCVDCGVMKKLENWCSLSLSCTTKTVSQYFYCNNIRVANSGHNLSACTVYFQVFMLVQVGYCLTFRGVLFSFWEQAIAVNWFLRHGFFWYRRSQLQGMALDGVSLNTINFIYLRWSYFSLVIPFCSTVMWQVTTYKLHLVMVVVCFL